MLQVGALPFPTGHGSQIHVRGTCAGLARRGHRVLLACYAPGQGSPPGIEVVRARPVPGGGRVGSGPHWSRPLHDAALVATVRRVLAREQVDVVHAHNVEGVLVAWAAGARALVYDQHTAMADELPTYLRRGRRVARLGGVAVDRLVPRLCRASVALSRSGVESLRARGVRDVALAPPGVDPADLVGADAERARRHHDLHGRRWVVYAGNVDPYQDLDVLVRAVARLPHAGLLLVSGGDLRQWDALCDRLGIAPERRRLVRSPRFADARDALAAADVAALPRTRCAGFPMKLLNQLGLGVPTVAARGSAAPIDGVVEVPDGDVDAMAGALGELLADPARARALGAAGRAAVLREWTWDARARRLEDVYARVAG